MKVIDKKLSNSELQVMAVRMYGNLVKAVVDVDKDILVVDAEMHVDLEQYLLQNGSKQSSLWGINLYPANFGSESFIEFDSMINIRPSINNLTRGVSDKSIADKIVKIVKDKIVE